MFRLDSFSSSSNSSGRRKAGEANEPEQTVCSNKSQMSSSSSSSRRVQLLSSLRIVFFVIGTSVIAFAAFCNSLTWHLTWLQRLWGASGDFWQAQWEKLVYRLGDDPETYWVYGSMVLTFTAYWVVGGLYTLMDLTGRPAWLRRYKIQPGTNEPVCFGELARVIGQVVFNQLVVGLPLAHMAYRLMRWRGSASSSSLLQLPTFHCFLAEIALHILCEEIGFYYSHRLLHSPRLYRHIHKQHHKWTAPIAVTAIYCHPIEHIGSNLLPPFLGVLIAGSHVATAWLWFCLAILSTLNAHSGYHLPFFPSPEAHDFHHLRFNQCFGVLGVLDRLHGTDTQFRNSKAYDRHIMMLSLVPAREAFPDDAEPKLLEAQQDKGFPEVAKTISRH